MSVTWKMKLLDCYLKTHHFTNVLTWTDLSLTPDPLSNVFEHHSV